jgi:hypothetical protein
MSGEAVDLALDSEQRVDALNGLDRDWRLVELRQLVKFAPRVRPAGRLDDRRRLTLRLVELVEPGIGVRLHQTSVACQMTFGMLAAAVAGVEERCCRRIGAGKRLVVPYIGPQPPRARLALPRPSTRFLPTRLDSGVHSKG